MLRRLNRVLFCVSLILPFAAPAAEVAVSDFAGRGLNGWDVKAFDGKTDYRLVENDGNTVLMARSSGAASGLVMETEIDLRRTPYLNWRWKIEEGPRGLNERTKAGDDYAARLYVVINGTFFWQIRALNYVWSGSQDAGADWANAFTSNAHMVAVRGRESQHGVWVEEKRNVYEDLKRYFGKEIAKIDAVALMTDTDNAKGSAVAYYDNIRFTDR